MFDGSGNRCADISQLVGARCGYEIDAFACIGVHIPFCNVIKYEVWTCIYMDAQTQPFNVFKSKNFPDIVRLFLERYCFCEKFNGIFYFNFRINADFLGMFYKTFLRICIFRIVL